MTKWMMFSELKIEIKLQDHYGNVKRKVQTWHGQLIIVSSLVMKFKEDIFLHEAGESNDGLRRHFPLSMIILSGYSSCSRQQACCKNNNSCACACRRCQNGSKSQ
jgi:hypothetical protein